MRRYIISHFREPMDIASSSLGEKHAIHGGGPNLKKGLLTVMEKYGASLVGVATTCLTETIGDDVSGLIKEFKRDFANCLPGRRGQRVHAQLRRLAHGRLSRRRAGPGRPAASNAEPTDAVNVFPGFVSPADIRHLKDIFERFGLGATILPDYSETLDGPALEDYEKISSGGTPLAAIKRMGAAPASIEFCATLPDPEKPESAGSLLRERFGVPLYRMGLPIGLRATDELFAALRGPLGPRNAPALPAGARPLHRFPGGRPQALPPEALGVPTAKKTPRGPGLAHGRDRGAPGAGGCGRQVGAHEGRRTRRLRGAHARTARGARRRGLLRHSRHGPRAGSRLLLGHSKATAWLAS